MHICIYTHVIIYKNMHNFEYIHICTNIFILDTHKYIYAYTFLHI